MERGFAIPDDGPELGDEAPSRAEAAADRRLADTIYERILGRIASGEFAVGAKLPTEHELSGVFGVSRPVLRQALKQLRTEGAIVSRQGSGSYVRRRPEDAVLTFAPIGSIADIQRTFEFRAAIEGEAAYLAAERRSAAMLQRIRQTLNELARCVRDGELGVEADEAFHALICDASNNHYFVSARNSMKTNILTGLRLTRSLSPSSGPMRRLLALSFGAYAHTHFDIGVAMRVAEERAAPYRHQHLFGRGASRAFGEAAQVTFNGNLVLRGTQPIWVPVLHHWRRSGYRRALRAEQLR